MQSSPIQIILLIFILAAALLALGYTIGQTITEEKAKRKLEKAEKLFKQLDADVCLYINTGLDDLVGRINKSRTALYRELKKEKAPFDIGC